MRRQPRWLLAALTVGLLAGPATLGCGPNDENNTNNPAQNNPDENNDPAVTNAISAADQTADPANEVVVESVTADVAGFVVIHEDDGGSPGSVIGHAAVDAGDSEDVTVELDRDAVDGETLHAMLHVDDPTDGDYTFGDDDSQDVPAVDADGDVVVDAFEVSVDGGEEITPAVTVSNQTADPANEVVVESVTAAADGWIVIHEDDGSGSFGAVLGQTFVNEGDNADVTVELSRDAVDGETLYAMLHIDDPADGNYTFDGSNGEDGPVTDDDGDVITPSFTVTVDGGEEITPAVTVADQAVSTPDEVVVESVTAAADGWMVIHEDDGSGSFGAVLGQTFVNEGDNADVTVELNRDIVEGETLYAMLHVDDPADGSYTFDGSNGEDGPVTDDDGVVVETFVVSYGLMPSVTATAQTADPADVVVIDEAISEGDGWMVIHADDGSGSFGAVIGHAALVGGQNTDVTVELDRPVLDGETLYAMLHTDDPADGNYTFDGSNGEDGPVTDSNGDVITPTFVASAGTSEPFVTAEDQDATTLDEVSVRQVLYDAEGWIVIHEDDGNGAPGDVIGNAAVTAGVNTDVVVTLNRDLADGETLYAMLHTDDGNGTYEFPGADAPVMKDGGTVTTPFVISLGAEPAVSVSDQTLSTVSTEVTIDSVTALDDGFIVIHEDDGAGNFGAAIGNASITAGATDDLTVTLDRPAAEGETLYAMLHTDDNGNDTYDGAGTDLPVTDSNGDVVTPTFVPTVPASTPAVIFTVDNVGASDYTFSATPAAYDSQLSDPAAGDPTLTLTEGWRYQFDVVNSGPHPIEFGNLSGANDDIRLSQGSVDPAEESDAAINWSDDGTGSVTFTVTSGLAAVLNGYRCEIHASSMRGDITVQ